MHDISGQGDCTTTSILKKGYLTVSKLNLSISILFHNTDTLYFISYTII